MCLSLRPFGRGKATSLKPALVAKAGELFSGGSLAVDFYLMLMYHNIQNQTVILKNVRTWLKTHRQFSLFGEGNARACPTSSDIAPCFVAPPHTVAKAHIRFCFMCAVSLSTSCYNFGMSISLPAVGRQVISLTA